jgi:hypothetical protein
MKNEEGKMKNEKERLTLLCACIFHVDTGSGYEWFR